jgi:protein-L-isoaspartate(D-aspartate) O-methyltransferase
MQHDFDQMRRAMVDSQLRPNAVNDAVVIAAMALVPRERFVPAGREPFAYLDAPIPLPGGRALNAPLVTGRLLTEAHPLPGDRVLIIGSATGYAAAVVTRLVASVVALEEDIGIEPVPSPGVRYVQGPLVEGWPGDAPYDLILIDGAVEHVPAGIVEQLADGGRLATGIVDRGVTRLAIGRKAGSGFGLVTFADTGAVVLPGFSAPPSFSF